MCHLEIDCAKDLCHVARRQKPFLKRNNTESAVTMPLLPFPHLQTSASVSAPTSSKPPLPGFRVALALSALLAFMLTSSRVSAAGTWTALTHKTPVVNATNQGNPTLMLQLSDGTVMVENDPTGGGGSNWFRLTPDIHGSYVNGTWTMLAPMDYTRAGCSSDVLTNGRVFVAGGEYGTGAATSEMYDPVSNIWIEIPVPLSLLNPTNLSPIWGGGTKQCFGDSISETLPNGNVLVAPVAVQTAEETMIYSVFSNAWFPGPSLHASSQSEASWVKLPDQSILTIDPSSTNSERYIPAANRWLVDAHVPEIVYSTNNTNVGAAAGELGPAFLLPNGQAIFFGSTTNNVIYTPSGSLASGTWSAAAPYPMVGTNAQGMPDAPGAMMVNGKILVVTGTADTFNGPLNFFEYDYVSNTFTRVSGPPGNGTNAAPYYTKLLDLPDGTVLWNYGQPQLYSYKPDGVPLASGMPTILSIVGNADGSYHLTGLGLNGISEGTAYGDDAQMSSAYPLVRMTNSSSGFVYYARTYNWNNTCVQTSNTVVTTEFALPATLPAGTYSLVAVANGIASNPVLFTTPLTAPVIANYNFSGANLILNCNNGLAGRSYYVLTSLDSSLPLAEWTPISTNVLSANGSFTITATNAVNPGNPQSFYTIQAQ
jgi:hypothetical protein